MLFAQRFDVCNHSGDAIIPIRVSMSLKTLHNLHAEVFDRPACNAITPRISQTMVMNDQFRAA
jgi:hypothetical protein